jgi:mannose/fructose/N-acetylgalactosamine-specific phosphotransferase system component IIC
MCRGFLIEEYMKETLLVVAIIGACALVYSTFKFDGKIEEPGMNKAQMQKNFESKPYLSR